MPPGASLLRPTMTLKILLLLRLVAFIAVFYLALHLLVARGSRKPGSKLLWFFEVLTAPLTGWVARFAPAGTPTPRLRLYALAVYVTIWLSAAVAVERIVAGG
jgi:hypothetical protein